MSDANGGDALPRCELVADVVASIQLEMTHAKRVNGQGPSSTCAVVTARSWKVLYAVAKDYLARHSADADAAPPKVAAGPRM